MIAAILVVFRSASFFKVFIDFYILLIFPL